MKNNKFIAQSFVPKTETKIVLENQSKLSLAAKNRIINKSGSNYQSLLIENDISEVRGYGPSSIVQVEWQLLQIIIMKKRLGHGLMALMQEDVLRERYGRKIWIRIEMAKTLAG